MDEKQKHRGTYVLPEGPWRWAGNMAADFMHIIGTWVGVAGPGTW